MTRRRWHHRRPPRPRFAGDSATTAGTRIIAGDTDGAWTSTVSWNGSYSCAKWWNKATDEPGKSDAWQKFGPTP
ncbi:hypothetical protein ACWGKU_15325 [Kitasatospora sp. NPDC054768]|uniref:hypothetical protein n=1 Tax=Kitasatospora sp. NBC_01519 TaxID=2903576 RepID=UPI002F90AB3D